MGDEVDGHTINFYDDEPDLPYSSSSELDAGIDHLHRNIVSLFPKALCIDSNHGSLVFRRGRKSKLSRRVFREWGDILEIPGWQWHNKLRVTTTGGDPFIFVHGRSAVSGKYSRSIAMNTVEGHYHTKREVFSWKGDLNRDKFGVKTGCMIDNKSLAFFYNKVNVDDVLLGHVIITNGLPRNLAMIVDKHDRWTGIVP